MYGNKIRLELSVQKKSFVQPIKCLTLTHTKQKFQDIICVSYPGVYRNEPPVIIPGASPIESVFVTERYGVNYECIETCYPVLNICDGKCNVMPDLPECSQCQRLPTVQPTPIIIETPPYVPRPPAFEHPAPPIVSFPRPPLFPKPNLPNPQPPRPMMPDIPHAPHVPDVEVLEPDSPELPDVPELELPDLTSVPVAPESGNSQTEFPIEVPNTHSPHSNLFEHLQPRPQLPPKPILPNVPRPPKFEPMLPSQPIIPDVPHTAPNLPNIPSPPKSILPERPLPSQPILSNVPPPPKPNLSKPPLPSEPILPEPPIAPEFTNLLPLPPDVEIYPEPDFLQPMFPHFPPPPKYEDFYIPDVPSVSVYEPHEMPVMQPILPETLNPEFIRVPGLLPPDQDVLTPENILYPESVVYLPEIVSETAGVPVDKDLLEPPMPEQDICNDYCLMKRNTSECEMCLKAEVSPNHSELCTNCLANPSGPDCELCYPILLNLCREFCIFEENEPDCSICYPQLLIEAPVILPDSFFNPLPTPIEYVPDVCPEYCVHAPMSPQCEGCGIQIVEKVCIDICAGYCLENPQDEQCGICFEQVTDADLIERPEVPELQVINFQCCYGDYCTPMPRSGICPVVCKEQCTSACSDECFNPTCPECQELMALNEYRRTQFMIWLKSKLSDMKSRYMAMIEACIRRTELMYERELQAIEVEVDTSLLLA